MTCLGCRYSTVITDSKGKYHHICTKVESPEFMEPVDYIFGHCDKGEPEGEDE